MKKRDYYVNEWNEVRLLISRYQAFIKIAGSQEEINLYQLTIKHLLARENMLKAFIGEDEVAPLNLK